MMFDVGTDSWIPTRTLRGESQLVGILDLLKQAHELEGLDGMDPMVEYGVYRFLTVFLMASYCPEDNETKEELLSDGCFDMEIICSYMEKCKEKGVSFDIFDSKHPFLQAEPNVKYDLDKNIKSAAELDNTKASGNNSIHFDHTLENDAVLTPAEAFRGLLAAQIFCTAGLKGPSNVNGAPPLFFLPKGKNLFETLVLAMVPLHETNAGEPLWESKTIIVPKQEVAKTSQLYGMLFPSRRIRLIEENGLVKQIYYQPGLHFTGFNGWSDPHVAYRLNKDGIPVSIKPSQDKEPWRNIGTMTENFREMAPLVIREFSEIQENRDLSEMPVMLFGAATSNASYLDVQRGMIRLDSNIVDSPEKGRCVGIAMTFAEDIASILRRGLRNVISAENSDRGTNEAHRFIHKFFSICEGEFYEYCQQLVNTNSDEERQVLQTAWQKKIQKIAWQIIDMVRNIYCQQAKDLMRAEKANGWMDSMIYKLIKGGK